MLQSILYGKPLKSRNNHNKYLHLSPIRKLDGNWAKSNAEKATTHLAKVFTPNSRKISLEQEEHIYVLILKPGKIANDVKSYRPISPLPILSKVFETLLLIKLMPIIEEKQLISTHQFGFRNTPQLTKFKSSEKQ